MNDSKRKEVDKKLNAMIDTSPDRYVLISNVVNVAKNTPDIFRDLMDIANVIMVLGRRK